MHWLISSFIWLCTVAVVGASGAVAGCLVADAAGEAVIVADVAENAEMTLVDGRVLRLAGVAAMNDEAMAGAIRRYVSGGVRLIAVAGLPDRWGRLSAHLAVSSGAGPQALVELLVRDGVAVWRADPLAAPRNPAKASEVVFSTACMTRLAALEDGARRAGRGAWEGAKSMPLAADDLDRLKRFAGRYVVVSGRVVSVGERPSMTFINFGNVWSRDFSVLIARRDWETMMETGVTGKMLEGRTVMVRGDLLLRETTGAAGRRNSGSAPAIRLSVIRGISILDQD